MIEGREVQAEMQLSIVIPCRNDEKTLPIVIDKALRAIARLGLEGEVVVSDGGSTDDSALVAEQAGARVVHCPIQGFGNTLIHGLSHARGEWLIMGEGDDSCDFSQIDGFVQQLEAGYDLVLGNRLIGHIEEGAIPPLHRHVGIPLLSKMLSRVFGTRCGDCSSSMRALTREAFRKLDLLSEGRELTAEMLIKAGLMRLRTTEIPISLSLGLREGGPRGLSWGDAWRNLRFMMLYAPKHIFIVPGLVMLFLGLLLIIPLSLGSQEIGFLKFDYHWSLLGSLLAVIGFQAITIGLFTKVYSCAHKYISADKFMANFERVFSLERCLLLGGSLLLGGFALNLVVLLEWLFSHFGALQRVGLVCLASTMMIFGLQTIFSSFFIAIMYLPRLSRTGQAASADGGDMRVPAGASECPPRNMDVTIAVVCYNEKDNIVGCLNSITQQRWPEGNFELVVVDNGSEDGTREILEELAKDFCIDMRIICNPQPGIAISRNIALRAARYDKVLFLDADCIAPRDWVAKYVDGWVDEAEGHPIVAMGGGNIAPRRGNDFQKSLGVMMDSYLGSRGSVQGLRFKGYTIIDHHPCLNLMIDRKIALDVDGFDEESYNFMSEDQDLSLRLNDKGYKYLFVPNNAVEHKLRSHWRQWAKNMYEYGKARTQLLADHPKTRSPIFLAIRLFAPLMILSPGVAVLAAIRDWSWWPVAALPAVLYVAGISLYSLRVCLRARQLRLIFTLVRSFVLTHYFYSLGMNKSYVGARVAS